MNEQTPTPIGVCTHCGKEPAIEAAQTGPARLCAKCADLRRNEDWSLESGTPQEGENCERFQGIVKETK